MYKYVAFVHKQIPCFGVPLRGLNRPSSGHFKKHVMAEDATRVETRDSLHETYTFAHRLNEAEERKMYM